MPRVLRSNELPEDARLWIFAAERPLDTAERQRLLAEVDPVHRPVGRTRHSCVTLTGRPWIYGTTSFSSSRLISRTARGRIVGVLDR